MVKIVGEEQTEEHRWMDYIIDQTIGPYLPGIPPVNVAKIRSMAHTGMRAVFRDGFRGRTDKEWEQEYIEACIAAVHSTYNGYLIMTATRQFKTWNNRPRILS